MATHSSVLAWRIPGKAEPGGLPSMGVAQSRTRLKRLSSSSSMVLTIVSRSSWGLRWEKKKQQNPLKRHVRHSETSPDTDILLYVVS